MQSALQFQASNPRTLAPLTTHTFATNVRSHRSLSFTKLSSLPLPLCSFTVQPSHYTSTLGSPQLTHWNLTSRHVTVLNVFACAVPSSLSLNKSFIISYHSSINETCVLSRADGGMYNVAVFLRDSDAPGLCYRFCV